MIDSLLPPSDLRPWFICETGTRWLHAVRRFAPAMIPTPLIVEVIATDAAQLPRLLQGSPCAVVLWEVGPDSVVDACRALVQSSHGTSPLQLIADHGLSNRGRLVLGEFPVAAMIRHPEQLPRLGPMIHGYFATRPQHVD